MTRERNTTTPAPEFNSRNAVLARLCGLGTLIAAIFLSVANGKGCEGENGQTDTSGFVTYSLDEHLNHGESAGKSPEFKAKSKEIAETTRKAIEDAKVPENSLSLEDVQKILQEEGGRGRLMEPSESDKKHVYHSGLDMYISTLDFVELVDWWTKNGADFFTETMVPHMKPMVPGDAKLDGTQELDQQGNPMFLPSLFERQLHEIHQKTGVWLNVKWGIRDFNARLVVWGRSFQKCLETGGAVDGLAKIGFFIQKFRGKKESTESMCSRAVQEDEAAKPKTPGNGHIAMDIDGWQLSKPAYDMLIGFGYIGGCESGLYPGDARHFSPRTIKAKESKKNKCLRKYPNLK
jgi:hypothetical protein